VGYNWSWNLPIYGPALEGFDDYYNSNDQKAGTYTYSNGKWSYGQ
jgi:hypothetical protein